MASSNIIIEQVLNRILDSKDINFILENDLTVDYFLGYEDEYYFIMDHYDKYKTVPDKITFADEFEDFNFFTVTESDEYLYDNLFELHYYNYIADSWDSIRELVSESPMQAMEKFQSLLLNAPKLKSEQGIDIIKGALERLKLIEDRDKAEKSYYIKTGFEELDTVINGWARGEEFVVIFGRTGHGKEQPLSSKVLTPNGWKLMRDIKIGDNVFSGTGDICKVTGVFPQGVKDVYRLTFSDGTYAECGLEHLWKVQDDEDRKNNNFKVLTLKEILNKGNQNYSIPFIKPIEYSKKNYGINPYLMGVLIGGGYFNKKDITVTLIDIELKDKVSKELNKIGYKLKSIKNSSINFKIVMNGADKAFYHLVENYNLLDKKYIPSDYLYGCIEDRIELLRGLMDTDGYIRNLDEVIFNTSSKELLSNMMDLLGSLGYFAKVIEDDKIEIKGLINPFNIQYKSKNWKVCDKQFNKYINNIEIVRKEECQCIMVDHEDHTYITDGYTITHNTWILLKALVTAFSAGNRVGFISPEMSAEKVGFRFDTLNKGFSNRDLTSNKIAEDEVNFKRYKEYIQDLSEYDNKFIVATMKDFNKRLTVSKLRSFIVKNKLDIVGIDGLTYMSDERHKRGDNKTIMLTNISEDLITLSNELKVPILVAVQSNRGGVIQGEEMGTPEIENIRDSDGIAQNATKVISIRQNQDKIDLAVKKHRDGKVGDTFSYYWDANVGSFEFTSLEKERASYRGSSENEYKPKERKTEVQEKRVRRNNKVRDF